MSNIVRTILWISSQENKSQRSTQVMSSPLYSLAISHSAVLKGKIFQKEIPTWSLNVITDHTTVTRNTKHSNVMGC